MTKLPEALRKKLLAAFDKHNEGGHPVALIFFDECARVIWEELAPLIKDARDALERCKMHTVITSDPDSAFMQANRAIDKLDKAGLME